MRLSSLVLCLSFGIPSFARSAPTVPADKELWQTLGELNSRANVARTARVAAHTGYNSLLAGLVGSSVALFSYNRHPRLFKGAAAVSALSWAATIFFMSVDSGAHLFDRFTFEPRGRMLGANDPERRAAIALFAFDDFFGKSHYEQYIVASEDRELRQYLIDLLQWMSNGVDNAPAPIRGAQR